MPHSTGGGSHSSHSSHSSGSSRSYSSSRSSGGGSFGGYRSSPRSTGGGSSGGYRSGTSAAARSTRPRVSSSPFSNAQCYVYYRNNRPQYVYSDYGSYRAGGRSGCLVPWVLLIAFVILMAMVDCMPAARLSAEYDRSIVIRDTVGAVNDEQALHAEMQKFCEETGIAPALVTMNSETWQGEYSALADAAYDMYVRLFPDENHWLLVYSESSANASEWYWEGMAGDNTGEILTQSAADVFGRRLQSLLEAGVPAGEAFREAFAVLTVELGKWHADSDSIMTAVVLVAVFVLIALKKSGRLSGRPKELPKDAEPVKKATAEIRCEYCGGIYLVNREKCPHCGAPRKN